MPGKNRDGSEGKHAQIEVTAEFAGVGIGDAAQQCAAVHLGKDEHKTEAQHDKQKGEDPVQKRVWLKGVGIPRDQREHKGGRYQHHLVAEIE